MDWKLYDREGNYVQDVNCQYDAIDLAVMLCEATVIEVDMKKQIARVLK